MSLSALAARATSAFPISIGTSLALESCLKGPNPAYDPARPIPQAIDLRNYDSVWINLLTLIRNIYQSVSSSEAKLLIARDTADVLAFECDLIREVIRKNSPQTQVVIYKCKYGEIQRTYPKAILREVKTANQVFFGEFVGEVVKIFEDHHAEPTDVKSCGLYLEPEPLHNGLLITHFAHDLLSADKFKTLALLESHTGVLKDKSRWHTKFCKSPVNTGIERIPFNKVMWQVFGDEELISAYPAKARQLVLEMARQNDWNSLTTLSRIRYCLDRLPDRFLAETLKSMF